MAKEGKESKKAPNEDSSTKPESKEEFKNNKNEIQSTSNSDKSINRISEYGGRAIDEREEREIRESNSNFSPELQNKSPDSSERRNENFLMADSIILDNKSEDPRMSVDFSQSQSQLSNSNPPQKQIDSFINRSQYNPQAYNRQPDYYEMNSRSVYNPNMSTMRFMADIDLRCDDHLMRLKEDWQADRYCSECKVLCCDSCVIEYHHSHIQAAKVKLEDYFKKQKNELEDLKSKINSSIKQKTVLGDLHSIMEAEEKNVSNYFLKRRTFLENLKSKIETLLCDENDLCNKMKENIKTFYQDECYRRMDKPLKEMESLFVRLQSFLRDWENFSRSDKARALKNDQVTLFKSEANELTDVVKKAVDVFKNKSKILERNLSEILKNFSYNDKLDALESLMLEISSKVKSSFSLTNKLNFEEIIYEEKVNNSLSSVEDNNFNLFDNKASVISNSAKVGISSEVSDQSNRNDKLGVFDFRHLASNQGDNSNKSNLSSFSPDYNKQNKVHPTIPITNYNIPNYSNPTNQINTNVSQGVNIPMSTLNNNFKTYSNISHPDQKKGTELNFTNNLSVPLLDSNHKPDSSFLYFNENKHNNDLLIGIKSKTDELVIYDARGSGLTTLKINPSNFQLADRTFSVFPDNCKYVNLGFSILLTGGYNNKEMSSNTYIIVVSKKEQVSLNQKDAYDVSIMPYANMLESRERHNIISLPDRNMVLVCSGFFNSNAEITDLNAGLWKPMPKMNDVRANATISYINRRFVWVFGGFKINEHKAGVYQNSCEVLDLENLSLGWTMIHTDKIGLSLNLSAMGVINIDNGSVLLCGGYDGSQYRKEVNKLCTNEKEIVKMEKFNSSLPGNFIFMHNNFVRVDKYAYNYDLQMNLIKFDPFDGSFKIHK